MPVRTVEETGCCIVGAGPAGVMLALLLARRGVRVSLLEAHGDFEREFRGNTLNPAALETLARLGLAGKVMKLHHAKVRRFVLQDARGRRETFADFTRLKSAYPYVLMLPQAQFLELVAAEAERYPNFRLVMGARVRELVEEDGIVRGVRYGGEDGLHEVRAGLTAGTDGRFSRLRRLAGLEPEVGSSSMDVFWFNLPRLPDDPEEAGAVFRFGRGSLLVMMDHSDHWQVGYIIPKGHYTRLKERGLPALRRSVAALAPELGDRVEMLEDWGQGSLLPVQSDRLRRWYKPGLLLIGDAAHVVSPIGGVGIHLAIEDAVVAANVLAGPLLEGDIRQRHLRAVQRRRSLSVRVVQYAQNLAQRHVVMDALDHEEPFELPRLLRLLLRTPVVRDLPTRLIAYGVWPARLK
ncbi:MAG: 2-polyprenyl-6-methoxyphenol hydroxylase and related FAD-dependent oxidoreductases [uncultured Rubrobacteraceae bacterium]|uniref:2-polyprenyl-6-methoxyphenol hydroxylase and related FAD-dependent oxidoreductases n=1 Tax=uncultured Rubrobacteraceae bacterium TaxID=349277 RepID=A0A6J4QTB7_9ACTN|nr:MAG: 2-polyprenyl-6-methoxyphenol hydroxylase and related FAD-dependent oxidoreductases [uncultured Rubrobacteraceae bacterium]